MADEVKPLELLHERALTDAKSENVELEQLSEGVKKSLSKIDSLVETYNAAPTDELKTKIENESGKLAHAIKDEVEKEKPEAPVEEPAPVVEDTPPPPPPADPPADETKKDADAQEEEEDEDLIDELTN